MWHFLTTLWGCLFVWHLKGTEDFSGADCIFAHAGAYTVDGKPGKMNEYLVEVVIGLHKRTVLPIFAQGELARLLTERGVPVVGSTPLQAESKEYIDSVYVTRACKKLCDQNGWRRVIMVSYHPHLWRGKAVAEKLGMEVIIPKIRPGIYDPECSQKWMRSPWLNTPRELACRLVWLLQGKI
jgi:hypothetical protein